MQISQHRCSLDDRKIQICKSWAHPQLFLEDAVKKTKHAFTAIIGINQDQLIEC